MKEATSKATQYRNYFTYEFVPEVNIFSNRSQCFINKLIIPVRTQTV